MSEYPPLVGRDFRQTTTSCGWLRYVLKDRDEQTLWLTARHKIAYSAETALAYSVGAYWRGLANNGMTDEQRRLLDPNSEEFMLRCVLPGGARGPHHE